MDKVVIWIDGPPAGVELKEKCRRNLSPPDENVTVITYQRADIPLATYQKVNKPDGTEKWCKERPKKTYFPVAPPPDIETLKEIGREQWHLAQGWRTVVSYCRAGNRFSDWYHKILNPEGEEWFELRHPNDEELGQG